MKRNQGVTQIQYIVVGFIVFFILLSMAPTFYEWNARERIHADRFFELVHNFPTDYNLYLSRIREGKEGAWLATEKYTSEPHAPSLSQIMYVVIGRLADYAHVQTPYVWFAYHVARVFFGALLLWVIWKVAEWFFSDRGIVSKTEPVWQLIAFLLVVTASTWPKFEEVSGVPRLGGWMGWYTMSDSLQRTTFMPHVTFAQAMMVFIFWVFSGGFITKKTPANYIFLGIIGIVLGIIFPPGLLFIYGVLGVIIFFEFMKIWWERGLGGRNITFAVIKTWFLRDLFGRFIFGVLSGPTFIYFALLLSQYPWKRLAEFDVLHPTKFSMIEYFMAMGPTLPLGLLAILLIIFLRRWDIWKKFSVFIAWVASWLVFLFAFEKIPAQSPTRFTQMAPHVPLAILTAYLFYELYGYLHSRKNFLAPLFASTGKIVSRNSTLRTPKFDHSTAELSKRSSKISPLASYHVAIIIPLIIILFGMGTMSSSYMWLKDFVDHKLRATIPLVPSGAEVMYPMRDIIDGIVWLEVNTPRSAIVLSGMTTGNYIPVYSGNTAFVGHANTVQLEDKMAAVNNFYVKRLPISEEMGWIISQHINYIFYGPEEQDISGGVPDLQTMYPSLTQVFKNDTVRIYQVPQ